MRTIEQWIKCMSHPVVVAIYMAIVVTCYELIDRPLAWIMHSYHVAQNFPAVGWVTLLGKSEYWLIVLPFFALLFKRGRRPKQIEWRIWYIWATMAVANGLCFVLKTLFGRARPELLFSDHIFGFFGFQTNSLYHSFPSGHTTQVTVTVLSLGLLYPRWRWWFVGAGVMILATRVLLTQHYLSDVLASMLLVILEYRLFLYIVAQQCPLYWKKLGVK